MENKLEFIRESLVEKMYNTLKAEKITSTEQLLNFAKAYSELSKDHNEPDLDKPDTI